MRKLVIVSALTILAASGLGCVRNNSLCGGGTSMCGGGTSLCGGGGLFARRAAQPTPVAYQCCDPCATGGVMTAAPMMGGSPIMTEGGLIETSTPCCQ